MQSKDLMMDKAKILILSTGGTITGIAQCKNALDYKVGKISIESILTPKIHTLADISVEQIANIDSIDLSDKILLKLARRISELMRDCACQGVIITHGTDRMEESAFFLHLSIRATIPLIFTGAMRPQNVRDSDGARNLYNALLFARSGVQNGIKGVFVAMGGSIFSARDVSKTHTLNLDAFSAPNAHALGKITRGKVHFCVESRLESKLKSSALSHIESRLESHKKSSVESNPISPPSDIFDISHTKKLSKVSIIYATLDAIPLIKCAIKAKHKGIIIVGSGAGSIPKNLKAFLAKILKKHKIIIVKSTHINAGAVLLSAKERACGFISAKDLNPQKARILLQLALLNKRTTREKIARIFERI